jgi:nicotinate-nucleotide adenylyltransferase
MRVGLFFGTFNPIHIGHLVIANHFAEHSNLDQVWLVVTPQNPFKKKQQMLDNHQRLELVYRAVEDYPKLLPCDIEFALPQPNYTVHSLAHLEEKYPKKEFALIMGEDNLNSLHKWKNYQFILEQYPIYVYPRLAETCNENKFAGKANITTVNAPIMALSSSAIRADIKAGKLTRPQLPEKVWQYIDEMNFYR